MRYLMNKRGEQDVETDKWILIVIPLFMLIAFSFAIGLGQGLFFGEDYEFRNVEAQILNLKVKDCISNNLYENIWADFYKVCNLNEKVLKERLEEVKLNIMVCEGECNSGKEVFRLGSDFTSCDLDGKNENYKKCYKDKFIKNGKSFEIWTGSNHVSRRTNA
ncbi:hypothetical protein COU54_04565 [Candidatus Pacearchaeota archaeon CG10_big_fil_rev_8_21_14_0_10_31_24]|nr:MAG: hypothetical protein COU54_04565 [Candidatus Pacearchaeota archaeon CG10_big_fil_rev_8_21_14_0_10_31_24]